MSPAFVLQDPLVEGTRKTLRGGYGPGTQALELMPFWASSEIGQSFRLVSAWQGAGSFFAWVLIL